jgi:cell division transport system ATP-binding protein
MSATLDWKPEPERPTRPASSLDPVQDDDLTMTTTAAALADPAPAPEQPAAQSGSGSMIVLENVRKIYDPNVVALDGVSFVIDKGEFVFVVGASGSGKSTIIRLLLKELEPTSGRILVGGRDLGRLKRSKVPLLRRNVGCVFQDFKLLPNRTAAENVAYALKVQGESTASIRRKVPEVLNLVGLSHKMSSRPDELSGGEQQRVSIARAVVNHPPLLICDEPTGNLDPDTSVGIMQLLHRINTAGGTTILMVTHDREMVDKMRKRVIALDHGKLMRDERRGGYETE